MLSDRFDRAMTAVMTAAALAVAGVAVRREFFATSPARSPSAAPTFQKDWKEALPIGHRIGSSRTRSTIVLFTDLECPACRAYHNVIRAVLNDHKEDLSLVFVPFPLGPHRFAVPAAQAAECAAVRNQFVPFLEAVYAKQDSLGLKSWGSFARDAGILDTSAIAMCARKRAPDQRVEAGLELGERWGIQGTPTILVNGLLYPLPPTKAEIERALRSNE